MEIELKQVNWLREENKGNYNGYVKIDKDSPFYGKGYDDKVPFLWNEENKTMTIGVDIKPDFITSVSYMLNVHGGITFSGNFDNPDEWWIGWDSCHHGDEGKWPYEKAMEETIRLAEQIENINKLWKAHTTYTNSQMAIWHLLKA